MGWFGDALKSGLSGGLSSGLSGAVSGLFGGIGYGSRLKKQVNAQKQLNEQAAKLNYEYGEKAAENAYQRQMQMYERSYQDQSYSAMRQQMEDAGLSVGLMYGGGGSGGAGGATTGAPQGETGGAEAGRADSPAAQQAAAIQQAQLGLGLVSMKKDLAIKDAQIEEINATAAKQRAEADNITEQKITEMQSRGVKIREIFERGKRNWIENLELYFEDALGGNINDELHAEDDLYGEHDIIGRRLKTRADATAIIGKQAEIYERIGNGNATNALAELNTERKKYVYMEAMAAAKNADAHMLEAQAKRLATLFETGEYANWKTWADYAAQGAQMLTDMAGQIIGFKMGAKALSKGGANAGKTKIDVPTVYGADGKPVARIIQ
nr:MAG TPA: hypothetical protein [Microviridae sp.]